MSEKIISLLACPSCSSDLQLSDTLKKADDDDIIEGALMCQGCNINFPIRNGIPRFAGDEQTDFTNFGYQWNRWGQVQIDRLSAHRLSEKRLLAETGWDVSWFKNKIILDGGCGAGRFADVAANFGAEIIAVDISQAIDACRENLSLHGNKVHCIQASLFDLPLKKDILDGAFSLGVIQHTPEPEKAITSIVSHIKPKGNLAVNFYEKNFWPALQVIKYALRLFTPYLSPGALLVLSKVLVRVFFPITYAIKNIRKVRLLSHFLPICSVHNPELSKDQQYSWTLLDTFDWYGPKYEIRQKHTRLGALLGELGMDNIQSRPGVIQATKPDTAHQVHLKDNR